MLGTLRPGTPGGTVARCGHLLRNDRGTQSTLCVMASSYHDDVVVVCTVWTQGDAADMRPRASRDVHVVSVTVGRGDVPRLAAMSVCVPRGKVAVWRRLTPRLTPSPGVHTVVAYGVQFESATRDDCIRTAVLCVCHARRLRCSVSVPCGGGTPCPHYALHIHAIRYVSYLVAHRDRSAPSWSVSLPGCWRPDACVLRAHTPSEMPCGDALLCATAAVVASRPSRKRARDPTCTLHNARGPRQSAAWSDRPGSVDCEARSPDGAGAAACRV